MPTQTVGGYGEALVEDGGLVGVFGIADIVNDVGLGAIGLRPGCPVEAVGALEQGLVDATDIQALALAVPQGAARLDGLCRIEAADDGTLFVGLV